MITKKIHRLIAEYKLEEAFEALFSLINLINRNQFHDHEKSALIILSARFHDLLHQKLIGIIDNHSAIVESNKIIHGILEVTRILTNSTEYSKIALGVEGESGNYVVIHDTSKIQNDSDLYGWGKFHTRRMFQNIDIKIDNKHGVEWHLFAVGDELVGANKFLNIIKGKVIFEYKPVKFNDVKDNLLFFMIPMKSNNNLIEVGTKIREDPNNGYSPFRIRKLAKSNINSWHTDEIQFDFSNTPEAECSVFAFRINEGTPRAGQGEMYVRNVKIYEEK